MSISRRPVLRCSEKIMPSPPSYCTPPISTEMFIKVKTKDSPASSSIKIFCNFKTKPDLRGSNQMDSSNRCCKTEPNDTHQSDTAAGKV